MATRDIGGFYFLVQAIKTMISLGFEAVFIVKEGVERADLGGLWHGFKATSALQEWRGVALIELMVRRASAYED